MGRPGRSSAERRTDCHGGQAAEPREAGMGGVHHRDYRRRAASRAARSLHRLGPLRAEEAGAAGYQGAPPQAHGTNGAASESIVSPHGILRIEAVQSDERRIGCPQPA